MNESAATAGEAEADADASRRSGHHLWWVLIVALPVLYVLGSGPAIYLLLKANDGKEHAWERPLTAFYQPLNYTRGTLLGPPIAAYMSWWAQLAKPELSY